MYKSKWGKSVSGVGGHLIEIPIIATPPPALLETDLSAVFKGHAICEGCECRKKGTVQKSYFYKRPPNHREGSEASSLLAGVVFSSAGILKNVQIFCERRRG